MFNSISAFTILNTSKLVKLDETFLQGITTNSTFESNTVWTAFISCLKLNSLLSLVKKVFPPSHTTFILEMISGVFFFA